MPRPAMHVQDGVLELMPICDDEYYSFKYVNCHPKNPANGSPLDQGCSAVDRK